MSESIVSLQCYEPSGTSVDFAREDILGHTLAIGGSGSGKTTRLVYPMIRQCITHTESPLSLCVIDTKADGAMRSVLENACGDAGRVDDLIIIDGQGEAFLECFQRKTKPDFDRIDALAALLGSSIPPDLINKYWEQTFGALLRQSLRLHALNPKADPSYAGLVKHIIDYLLRHQIRDPQYVELIDHLKATKENHDAVAQLIIEEVIATHRMWDTLDYRTRSNLQSMATSITTPMNNAIAHRYFNGRSGVDIGSAMGSGKIVLISIDAIRFPECARLIGCLAKGLFYDSVLKSPDSHTGSTPFKGLVLDDWPIAVTAGRGNRYSDVEALSIIRSRGGFVVAAIQSLAALDLAVGKPARDGALANFANLLFFRCRDPEVDYLAASYLGQKSERLVDVSITEKPTYSNRQFPPVRIEREIKVPAVPPGALARLATGDAYALVGNSVYSEQLCIVPVFSNPQPDINHE